MKEINDLKGSHNNIWYGLGRQRIEIPRTILRSKVINSASMGHLFLSSIGYYPNAKHHYTYRKKGLSGNILIYCVHGKGWCEINQQKFEVKPNEFFILPQNVEHAYGCGDVDPWTIYWIYVEGSSLKELNLMQQIQKKFKPSYIKSNSEIIPLFQKMYKTLELGYSIDNLMFSNMCLSEFISLFVYNDRHYEASMDKTDVVDNAILYMQEQINENISLGDLSRKNNYSVSRFSNLFKQKTGYAPIDYFLQMKMQKACQQLDFTNLSIKEIAFSMGFEDPYYFSKRFKTIIGMSPKKYRAITGSKS
jgi:AraC family transcriptional regulator, arabinose operon regulatory protein